MGRWIVSILAFVVACKSKPKFELPSEDLGGFVAQCVSVTDFQERLTPCDPNLAATRGGCACAQPGVPLGRPPLDAMGFYQLGVIAFQDTSCETDTPLTCVPSVIPTDPAFKDPFRTNKGELQTQKLIQSHTRSDHINQLESTDVGDYAGLMLGDGNNMAIAQGVARDMNNEVQTDCKNAHYSILTQRIFGYAKGTIDWASALPMVAIKYDPYTTGLNPDHFKPRGAPDFLQRWGSLESEAPTKDSDLGFIPYATAQWFGGGTTQTFSGYVSCNKGLKVSGNRGETWGLAALNDFNSETYVSNPPPPQTPGGRVAPRQSVLLGNGSSGLLSVRGIDETAALALAGGVEVSFSNCSADGSSCAATLDSLALTAGSFSFQGFDVASIAVNRVTSSGGALVGSTLTFTSLSGNVRVTLTDGRYADTPIESGVILATWNAETRMAVMAFAFDTELDDGTEVTINGTAFGNFDNTSPTARIAVASPASERVGGEVNVECQSPSGTTVTLDGAQSSDRESGAPRLGWWGDDVSPVARLSTSSQLVLSALPLGSARDVTLMAYDARGLAGDDRLKVSIVDTLPAEITAPDLCVFPPNKKEFCVRLGRELQVTAIDKCDGDVGDSVQITGVTSSTGMGVVSFDARQACLIADRDGQGDGTTYEVTVTASDQSGNVGAHKISVVVPHNGPTKQCLHQVKGSFQ